ncbi:MAG: hypothetical protein HY736_27230 [Verrucomicrobia bacterium]|nr:hypothetical protein [Verrucomicrobiota bacterium]
MSQNVAKTEWLVRWEGRPAAGEVQLAEEVRFVKRPAAEQAQVTAALVLDRHVYRNSDVDARGFVTIVPTKTPLGQLAVDLSLAQGDTVIARQSLGAPGEQMVAFLLPIRNLAEGDYALTATVTGANESSTAAWRSRKIAETRPAGIKEHGRLRLTLPRRDFLKDTSWPVRTGVPFPKGDLADAARVRLLADGQEVPCQVDVRARWSPHGSIRWLGLAFVADDRGGKSPTYKLEYGVEPQAVPAQPVAVQQDADAITVTTGPLKFVIQKKAYDGLHAALLDTNGDGSWPGDLGDTLSDEEEHKDNRIYMFLSAHT